MIKDLTFLKAIAVIFLISLLISPGVACSQPVKIQVTRVDFVLTLNDGVKLDCTKFYPLNAPSAGGWPAIIYCHGYGGTKKDLLADAQDVASSGYFTICYSMRGQGLSRGFSNLISTTEMNDFAQVVNYVRLQPIVKATHIGAFGASQGGTIPFMAACNGTSLRCIVSDVSSPEFASSLIENNSVKMSLLWSVSYDTNTVRFNPTIKALRKWILADTKEKWDSIAYYTPLNRDFANKLMFCTASMYIGTVWQDKFFSSNGFLKNIFNLPGKYKMYNGTFNAHGSDNFPAENEYHSDVSKDFFNYWLKDVNNGVMDSSTFTYASSKYPRVKNVWTWERFSSPVWPPAGIQNVKFFFHPTGKLYNYTNSNFLDTISFYNDVKDSTMTMADAVNREFTGPVFDTKFGKSTLSFDSPSMAQTCRIIGIPKINLHYKSNSDKVQFNVQIWCLSKDGTENFVARGNYTVRNNVPNSIRQLTFDGMAFSHIFQQGEKIRIKITNLDNSPEDVFLRTNPHVLPSLKRAKNVIFMNSANPSYIEFPMINFIISVNLISNIAPDEYSLSQNTPNPFNPATTIRFQIKENQNVLIRVFDVPGNEVTTIVNEKLKPGTYDANWDAGGFASGIYIYTIEAGAYTETKKMILVK